MAYCTNLFKRVFRLFGMSVLKSSTLAVLEIKASDNCHSDLKFVQAIEPIHQKSVLENLDKSKSQLRQDLFVLSQLNWKRSGFFVEFGATNGSDLSNTFLLEADFNWTGILAEPAIGWREALIKNRPTARLDFRGVWRESGASVTFLESAEPELSTIESFRKADLHAKSRKRRKDTYEVKTISLLDLLTEHQAPKIIDYLSIDTEGSEYEILSTFDFDKFTFSIITVEHNFTSNREEIFTLLSENGYERRLSDISLFDDWYVFVGPKK